MTNTLAECFRVLQIQYPAPDGAGNHIAHDVVNDVLRLGLWIDGHIRYFVLDSEEELYDVHTLIASVDQLLHSGDDGLEKTIDAVHKQEYAAVGNAANMKKCTVMDTTFNF